MPSTRAKACPRNSAKASRPMQSTGRDRWKMVCATSTPRVRISSGSASTNAAGAWPLLINSINTLLPVHEPRPLGMASTRPARCSPLRGWWRSMTSPVAGSTPPQKLSPTSANSRAPWAAPPTRLRPLREMDLGIPDTLVVDLWHGQVGRRNVGTDPFDEQLLVAPGAHLLVDEQVEVVEQAVLVALGTE
ncbi:hypothetical protein D3C76_1059910 [compost metagenome]